MSTIRVVNLQHTDATEPNIVLQSDGTSVFASGITISGGTNLTVSGTAEFASGTVSAPSITFIDDNNTGIYEPAADTVAITTAATERLRVDSSGNLLVGLTTAVGIGGTPADLNSTEIGRGYINISRDDTQAADHIRFGKNGSVASSIGTSTTNSLTFKIGTTERLRIDSSGNVIIGSTTAASNCQLTVRNANAQLALYSTPGGLSVLHMGDTDNHSDGQILYDNSSGYMKFVTRDSEQMRIDSSGRLLVGATGATQSYMTLSLKGNGASSTNQATIGLSKGATPSGTDQELGRIEFFDPGGNPGGHIVAISEAAWTAGSSHPTGLKFATTASSAASSTERMRIRSNGDVIVGPYRAPGTYGTVAQNIPYSIKAAPYGWANGSEIAAISMGSHNGTGQDDGQIVFKTAADVHSSSTGLQERVRILSTGGMTFNGDTAQANALDDYEEGTFTPNAFGATTIGNTTYGLQFGAYVKVGQLCHIQIRLQVNSMTGTGNLRIGGLPFTAMNDLQRGYGSMAISYVDNLTMPGSGTQYGGFTEYNQTYIRMMGITPTSNIAPILTDSSFVILMSGTYKTT